MAKKPPAASRKTASVGRSVSRRIEGTTPRKLARQHRPVDPLRPLHGAQEERAHDADEDPHAGASLSEGAHLPRADDAHPLLHEDEEVPVQERSWETKRAGSPSRRKPRQMPGKEVVAISRRAALIVSANLTRIDAKETQPAETRTPGVIRHDAGVEQRIEDPDEHR